MPRSTSASILHPRMRKTFEKAIARAGRRGQHQAVVLDAAILFEAGWNALCDRVVFVDAPRDLRLARLAAGRGWSAEKLAARESAQWPVDQKRRSADVILTNEGDVEALAPAVARAWDELTRPPRPKRRAGPTRPPL